MASIFKDSVAQAIAEQPWYVTYKGSVLIVLSGVVSILADLAQSQDLKDLGWGSAIGVVATVGAFLVNRFTRDGVTKSAAARLEQAGANANLNRLSVSGVAAVNPPEHRVDNGLPVYDQPSTSE